MQHTHFGSATNGTATFLHVLIFGTLWRIASFHGVRSRRPLVRRLARMALFQY